MRLINLLFTNNAAFALLLLANISCKNSKSRNMIKSTPKIKDISKIITKSFSRKLNINIPDGIYNIISRYHADNYVLSCKKIKSIEINKDFIKLKSYILPWA